MTLPKRFRMLFMVLCLWCNVPLGAQEGSQLFQRGFEAFRGPASGMLMPRAGVNSYLIEYPNSLDIRRYSLVDKQDILFHLVPSNARVIEGWTGSLQDYAATASGGLCVLSRWDKANAPPQYEIVTFASDGRISSRNRLEQPDMTPFRAAQFETGEILVLGSGTEPAPKPLAMLLDSNGNKLRQLSAANFVSHSENAAQPETSSSDSAGGYERIVALSSLALAAASDDSIYLTGADGHIFRITNRGDVIRLPIEPSHSATTSLLVDQRRLMILERVTAPSAPHTPETDGTAKPLPQAGAILVYDARTGEMRNRYTLPQDVGILLLGVAENDFFFLKSNVDEQSGKRSWVINRLSP